MVRAYAVRIRLFGVPNVHVLNVTSESCSPDKQTHMDLLQTRLWIHLSRETNTCTLLDLERQVLYFYENI